MSFARKIPLLILFISFVSSASGQTYSSIISDSEIVGFLNWKFQFEKKYNEESKNGPKQLFYKILNWDTATFFPERKSLKQQLRSTYYLFPSEWSSKWIDTIFSKEDREHLYHQFNSQKDTIWKNNFPKTKLFKQLKQKKINRYYVSLPLFSIDKRYVIIKQLYYCGTLCAYGGFRIYKRKGNSWEYVGIVNEWVS